MRNQTGMMSVADWRVQRCPGCGHLVVALLAWPGPAIGVRITHSEAQLLGRARHPSCRTRIARVLHRWAADNARIEVGRDRGRLRAILIRRDPSDTRSQPIPFVSALLLADLTGLPLLIETSLGDQPHDLPRAGEDIQEFREFLEQISADDFRAFDTDPTSPDR